MDWTAVGVVAGVAVPFLGALFVLVHYYVSKTAESKANDAVKEHIASCPLPGILSELQKDVRQIRDHLLGTEEGSR